VNVSKTRQSIRDVYITAPALDALREQRRRQAEARLAAGPAWQDHGLVFPDAVGEVVDPSLVSHRIHVLLTPIGLPAFRCHDL
jgi:integrase